MTDLPANPKGPLPEYQLHYIASCLAGGYPTERIALATGIPEDRIKRLKAEPSVKLRQLIDQYRFQQQAGDMKFRMETAEMWNQSVDRVRKTIEQDKDPRLAYEAAKDVLAIHGAVFPRDQHKEPAGPGVQFNLIADNRVQTALTATVESITESNKELVKSLPGLKGLTAGPHLRTSEAEALEPTPRPEKGNGTDLEPGPE